MHTYCMLSFGCDMLLVREFEAHELISPLLKQAYFRVGVADIPLLDWAVRSLRLILTVACKRQRLFCD